MLRLRDIMTTDVTTVDPNITIREAMDVFASERISGAPVVAGGEVIGVVSATDLLQLAASLPPLPAEGERTADLLDDPIDDDAADGPLPDLGDDPSAVYFMELWDDVGATVVERMAVAKGLEDHTVSEVMTRAPIHALGPDALVPVAAEFMARLNIHRVLVMTGRKLVGIVTTSDVTRAVAAGKLTSHTYVFDHPRSRPLRGPLGRHR
jgi:CBS domain-containing protein